MLCNCVQTTGPSIGFLNCFTFDAEILYLRHNNWLSSECPLEVIHSLGGGGTVHGRSGTHNPTTGWSFDLSIQCVDRSLNFCVGASDMAWIASTVSQS